MPKKQKTVKISDYTLVTEAKYRRVFGSQEYGGLGKKEATDEEILACYDKFAGMILDKQGNKVPRGTFWDFENKKPVEVKAPVKKEVKTPFKKTVTKKK